ncbi:RepB family plasmid replication initiator protein, partial [Helicobacter pylori]
VKNKALNFKVHNDLIKWQMGFLNAVEFNYFICILYHLKDKGEGVVFLDRYFLNKTIDKKYLNYRYNACMKSMCYKLENHGFIGKSNNAIFGNFNLVVVNGYIKGFEISINKDKLYLINNVKTCYFTIDLGAFQTLSTFTAKALYCWYCRNKSKDSFFIASSLLKGCVGINFNSTSGDAIKIKNALKCLCSVGVVLKAEKNKASASKSSLYNIKFYNTSTFNQVVTNPPTLTKENMAENNPTHKPTPFKENDAIIRFKNSDKTLNKDKANPTIIPTIKNANNKPIQANNEKLNKFENIVLTSPKYFDYTIKSVTFGLLIIFLARLLILIAYYLLF